ncbi:MAG: hypothetical protein AAGF73_09890 [Actinomycetota bacterium]
MTSPTRPSFRPRMLARTSILAAAAVLSVGATVHANVQGTDNNATTGSAANVLVYELDLTSSKMLGQAVTAGSGTFQIHDDTATFDFEIRTASSVRTPARLIAEASNFAPPAAGESIQVPTDQGLIAFLDGGFQPVSALNVSNVDGTYEVRAGTDTVAVFRPA